MKLIVKNIKWDCEDENLSSLPDNVIITNPRGLINDSVIDDDAVLDYLSNEFGYCIESFERELEYGG